ncbi:glycosyltransferase family 1 protein [Calocera viscosa TUFC12733]|uniref:Glycosyltransferase family 1 protein n=1 Tax=Calocera viscosa (strain TUFC12733) TaxID=1330018 RepID=A0A167PZV8_CALVF|nr:glycosyltransferase family 1 protein [Calocera viscosa TUFC12733]
MGDAPLEKKSHFVMIAERAMGHLRPECGLAVRLVRMHPSLIISFLANVDFVHRAKDEMQRQCDDLERLPLLSRIRIIGVGNTLGPVNNITDARGRLFVADNMVPDVPGAFAAVMADECYVDGNSVKWEPVGCKPTLLIGDVLMGHVIVPLKLQYQIPLLVWMAGAASVFTRMSAPAKLGGLGQYQEEVEATFADDKLRDGRSFDEIAEQTYSGSKWMSGNIVRVKGLPLHYQWEVSPQPAWLPISYLMYVAMISLLKVADGVLLGTVVDLEPEAFQGVIDFWGNDGKRDILALGPMIPREYFSTTDRTEAVSAVSEDDQCKDECINFLDAALKKYGVKSALYISFGTIAWPLVPTHIPTLIDVLLKLDPPMPFVLTTPGSMLAPLPGDLRETVQASGRGLIVDWAPQQAMLSHPALGWVLTHAGGNTIYECLTQGVPLIAWPLFGDQPIHALWLSQVVQVAYEFVQTRTGKGAQKAYRGGLAGTEIKGTDEALREEIEHVLALARGEDGRRIRRNAERARELILASVKPGAQVSEHLETLKKYM